MLMAITAQRAHGLGFLAEGDTQQKVWAARICRGASGRVATNIFARDLDLELHNATRRFEVVADGWPPFGRAQLVVDTWSVLFEVMGRREQGHREGTALRWQPQDVRKSGVALNWWRDTRGRGWLCWMWRWGDDGREKHRSFCPSWRKPEHVLKGGSSVEERTGMEGSLGVCADAHSGEGSGHIAS